MMLFLASCASTSATQETFVPVQNNIVKPSRPNSVVAPKQYIHVITQGTQEKKLKENKVYIGYTWDQYIDEIKFKNDVLLFIEEQNNILKYYEDTADDLNGKEVYQKEE